MSAPRTMFWLTPEERDALGLEPDAALVEIDRDKSSQGEHFQSSKFSSLDGARDGLPGLSMSGEPVSPVRLAKLEQHLPGAQLVRWSRDCDVLMLLMKSHVDIVFAGECKWSSRACLLIDARVRPAHAVWSHGEQRFLLRFNRGEVTLFKATLASIPAPDIASFLGQAVAQQWLVELAMGMAQSPSPFQRAAAAGVLARLWSSPDKTGRLRTREWLSAGHADPTAAAVRWVQDLGHERRELIESSALRELDALERSLDGLIDIALEDPDAANAIGRSWLHRRDDLQSVLFLLRRADAGGALARAVVKLDEHAARHQELWRLFELHADERLRAISWQEPDAWWGLLFV